MGLMLVTFVGVNYLGLDVPVAWRPYVNVGLALFPAILWVLFSRVPENDALEPRRRLLTTFTVTALVANAIGLPVLNVILQPDTWLPLESTVNRILGYMLTIGALQEFLKYLVLRYIVYPDYYRVRTDAVAYGAATAIAYAMVVNLAYVLSNPSAAVDVVLIRVFATVAMHLVGSLVVGLGLTETLFSDALSLFMPMMIVLAAFLTGIAIAMRGTFMNATLGLTISEQREIFGVIFTVIFYIGPLATFYFLFNVTEQREQDKVMGQEI